jgi:dienelactone hydrolase
MQPTDPLTDFSQFEFDHEGKRRTVYRKGTGPAVIVMHEVPGITPQVARFARYVVDAGMTAFMPHLFGVPGKPVTRAYATKEMARACISREFRVLAENRSSPIVDWLRALRAEPTTRSAAEAWARSGCASPETSL